MKNMSLRRYLARLHRLPKEWSEMMARKTWATISEETLHQGTAALCFLRSYMKDNMGRQGIRISHGCFSKFAVELCLMIRSAGDGFPEYLGFCLGNAFWSSLFWPVCLYQDGDFEGFFLGPQGEAEWVHVVNPQAWTVLVHDAVLCGNQILMVVNSRVPLLHFFLEKASHRKALTISDLTSLAEVLSLGRDQFDPKKMNRETLLKAIIDHVGVNDPDWLSKVKDSMDKPVPEKQIGDFLDELLMAELPQEDQREFKEISEEIDNKKRCGWNLVEQRWKKATAKRKARAKAKQKAKAKPKAGAMARRCRKRKQPEAEVVPLDPVVPLEPVAPLEPLPELDAPDAEMVEVAPPEARLDAPAEALHPQPDAEMVDAAPPEARVVEAEAEAEPLEQAAEAPAPVDGELPLADPAPRPAAAGRVIAGRRDEVILWSDIFCEHCGDHCGQIKLDPHPGNRDEPTWVMRVQNEHGVWPQKGGLFRRRIARLIGDGPEGATKWVMHMRKCCDVGK